MLQGEIITTRDTVRVVGFIDPMKQNRVDIAIPAGHSVKELIDQATAARSRPRLPHSLVAQINGQPIPHDWWPRVRPRPGTVVTFFVRLHGDSSRSLLMLGISLAAMIIAPWAAGVLLPGLAAGSLLLSAAQGLIGAAIVGGGLLALNQLFPIRPPQLQVQQGGGKSVASIQGGSNTVNRYGAVPVVLGTHRFYPPFVIMPRTEIVGDDQYLRGAVVWGIGRHNRVDYKIGETPIGDFDDAEWEHRAGSVIDDPLTLITRDVFEEQLNLNLKSDEPDVVRTTQPNTLEISVDVTAPEGIYRVNKETGAYKTHEVSVEFSYRPVSGGAWTLFDTITFKRETNTARKAARVKVAAGEYEVQAHPINTNSDSTQDNVKDTVLWTVLRSVTGLHSIKFPKPLAMTAFRIRATDQLNGVIEQLNAIVSSLVLAYDGSDWVANQPSSNPADLFRHVLQGVVQLRPKPNSEIDIETLQDWWEYCDDKGFTYNKVVDTFQGSWDLLSEIAAAGRAFPIHRDGKWSVAWDNPDDVIKQHFTPKNAWAFESEKIFAEETHAWRIPFIDEDKNYAESEQTVYNDGYNANNATQFEHIEFPGVTKRSLIWKHGRFHIAQIELRPQTSSFTTDLEGLIAQRGDRVHFASEIDLIGTVSGYIRGSGTSGGVQFIDIDEVVTLVPGQDYAIGFTLFNGTYVTRAVTVPSGGAETSHLLLSGMGDMPTATPIDEGGELYSFGVANYETVVMRVKEIAYQDELRARVVVVDDAPAISEADQGPIPDYDPGITLPVDPSELPPRDIRVLSWLVASGKSLSLMARVSWQVPRLAFISRFEVQKRDEDAQGVWKRAAIVNAPKTEAEFPLDSEGVWSFRVRCIFKDETHSAWAYAMNRLMTGSQDKPTKIQNLHRTYVAGNSTLDWDEVRDARTVRYEVRRGASEVAAMTIADKLAQPRYATVGDGTYWIASYVLTPDGVRIYSDWSSTELLDSVIVKNVIVEYDEKDLGWPGEFEGAAVSAGVLTANGDPIVSGWATQIIADLALPTDEVFRTFVYVAPIAHLVDVQRIVDCPLNCIWEGVGAPVGASFLDITDLLAQADILGQEAARFVRVIPVMRVARTEAGVELDVFAPADIFDEADVYGGGIEWEPWQPFSPGALKGRFFQMGLVGYSLDPEINPSCPAFRWSVDVPDRLDNYNNLTVPNTGYAITFRPDESPATPAPFNGGTAGQSLPNVGGAIAGAVTTGDKVEINNLTLDGCTVKVWNENSLSYVTRAGVHIRAFGY